MKYEEVRKIWNENAKTWQEASEKGYDIWRDALNTPAFLKMLPDVSNLSGLDVGCGEAHNSRLIAQRCKFLTCVDIADEFLALNKNSNNPLNISYQKVNAESMPFSNGYFDFVVATMSFMDMANLENVLMEINRVLTSDGFLQFSIVHPCFNEHHGKWIKDEKGNETGFLMKDYFVETEGEVEVWQHEHSPVHMPKFRTPRFWRPLNKWLTLLADVGFSIEEVCEPYPDKQTLKEHPELARSRIVAHSLIIRARKDRQTKNVLRKLIEDLPGNVWWKDKNLVYLGCNDKVLQVLGLTSRKEFIGKKDHELWEKNIADKLEQADLYVLKTGETINLEETIVENNGRHAIMLTNKSPFYDEHGNIAGIVGTSTDITDRKQQEEELKIAKEHAETASRAKSEFLENMRHDIRTPLAGITGFAKILMDEAVEPKIKEYAENIVASSDALQDFLNEILEAVRATSGEVPLLKNKFDLKKRLHDVIELNRAKAKQKQLELSFDYDAKIPAYLIGDARRVQRVVLELVTNALNFTAKGSVRVMVSLAKQEQRDIVIKIVVADTGIGIPHDKQQEIFAHFKRLTPSYEGIYKGAGLGLAVIKQFIDDLDGEVYVESELNKGATFTCIIPLREALLNEEFGMETNGVGGAMTVKQNTATEKSTSTSEGAEKVSSDMTRILLVEDNVIATKMALHILSALNCHVDHAPNGQAALMLVKQHPYDLIFMDVGLPDISGLEVTKRIRLEHWNVDAQIPIVALTAHVGGEDKQLCIEAGMNAVLSKPLMRETAGDILNAFIPKRAAKSEMGVSSQEKAAATNNNNQSHLLQLEGAVLDRDAGLQLTNGNATLLDELLEMLIKSFPEELPHLQTAYQQSDWEGVRAIAHKLKGGATYCGAVRLRQACSNLDSYLRTGARELAEALYQQMLNEIEQVRKQS